MNARPNVLAYACFMTLLAVSTAQPATAPRGQGSMPYVVITDAALAAAFAPLAAAHTAAGLPTEVHTVQEIVAAYPVAADDAERIRDFLIDAHATRGTRFALLGGDDPLVPIRRVFVRLSAVTGQPDLLLPTDQYYACLGGTWNADGDGYWGELPYPPLGEPGDDVSVIPDLAVGRAPVTTVAQANTFVAKSLSALAAQDGSQPVSALLAAGALFPGTPNQFDEAAFMESLLPLLSIHPATHVARLYLLSSNWPGSFPESRTSVLDSLNRGYDVAIFDGQGGVGQFLAGNDPADLVSAADFGALTNAARTFAVLTSAYTTQPGAGSVGAAWMNDASGGATSVVGSSDIQFLSVAEQFEREFVRQSLELHAPTQGEALANAITALQSLFSFTELTRLTTEGNILLGDPALAWPGSSVGSPVPTLLSLADCATGPGWVTLRWQVSSAAAIRATVERSTDPSSWTTLGAPRLEGTDLLVYDDVNVAPGRYSYRLAYTDGTLQRFSDPVAVDVPAAAQLALGGFRPNPAVGASAIVFGLPDAKPSRLEVVDVRGRMVLSREVGMLGPGMHSVPLSEAGRLGPGIYWVRLVRPEATLTRKGVVAG